MNFQSEYGEDKWVAANLPVPDKGVYLDVGCATPGRGSNTAWLRSWGWTGMAIDGNDRWEHEWAGLPGVQFVRTVISPEPLVRFSEREMESRIEPGGNPSIAWRLDSILADRMTHEGGEIDFLSVDVEGQEFEVFQTFDLERWKPKIIVAEYNTSGLGLDFRLLNYLVATRHYAVVHQTVANFVYVRK